MDLKVRPRSGSLTPNCNTDSTHTVLLIHFSIDTISEHPEKNCKALFCIVCTCFYTSKPHTPAPQCSIEKTNAL